MDDDGTTPPSERSTPSRDDNGYDESGDSGQQGSDESAETDTNSGASSQAAGGASTRPPQNLSSRQVGKRPMPANDEGDLQSKKARVPADESALEDAANPRGPFKVELTPSSAQREPSVQREAQHDTSQHVNCSRHPLDRCIDPKLGCPMPAYNKFSPPPYVVYKNEHRWASAGLDDEQVRFILSYCSCDTIDYFRGAWESMVTANAENRSLSRFAVLSLRYHDELNAAIRKHCPSKPQWPGEIIVIPDD